MCLKIGLNSIVVFKKGIDMYKIQEDRIAELEDVIYDIQKLLDKQDERIRDLELELKSLRDYANEFCLAK